MKYISMGKHFRKHLGLLMWIDKFLYRLYGTCIVSALLIWKYLVPIGTGDKKINL